MISLSIVDSSFSSRASSAFRLVPPALDLDFDFEDGVSADISRAANVAKTKTHVRTARQFRERKVIFSSLVVHLGAVRSERADCRGGQPSPLEMIPEGEAIVITMIPGNRGLLFFRRQPPLAKPADGIGGNRNHRSACSFAAVSVLRSSMAIVIGPTPPGTGVMNDAIGLTSA